MDLKEMHRAAHWPHALADVEPEATRVDGFALAGGSEFPPPALRGITIGIADKRMRRARVEGVA